MRNKKMIIIISIVLIVILGGMLFFSRGKSYDIKIRIPAGSTELYVYSEEEISPQKNKITITSGEGLGDTEVKLLPVEVNEERAYDEGIYITRGMKSEIEVEKGAWFKIGVNIQNPTDEEMIVYVTVSDVEVRIE